MKRFIFLVGFILILCSMVLADTSTLIDFTQLSKDFPADKPQYNRRTAMNFSKEAGAGFTEEDKRLMVVSLGLDEWRVELASSSRTTQRVANSICKQAVTAPNASDYNGEDMKSRTILGVRIMFPESAFNSYAIIKPPFEIQAYQDKQTIQDDFTPVVADEDKGKGDMFDNFGVIKNVGIIKDIQVTVYGANFPHGLEIILQNENFEQQSFHIAYLDYEGWATQTWTNPNYISDVRNREVRKFPLYPKEMPYQKFIGFVVYRDANALGGDFITYFKDVKMTYDKAVRTLDEPQIEDEKMWGILETRAAKRRKAEYKRLGAQQVLELIERQKMDTSTSNTE